MKSLLILFFLSISSFLFAQAPDVSALSSSYNGVAGHNAFMNDLRFYKNEEELVHYEELLKMYEQNDGSPFLHEDVIVVDLVVNDGRIRKNEKVYYDLNKDILSMRDPDGNVLIIDKKSITGFEFVDDKQQKATYRFITNSEGINHYNYIVFENEDFCLFRSINVKTLVPNNKVPGQTNRTRFQQFKEYYVYTKNKLHRVKLQKTDDVMALIPSKYRPRIKSKMKELNYKKLKKEQDYKLVLSAAL